MNRFKYLSLGCMLGALAVLCCGSVLAPKPETQALDRVANNIVLNAIYAEQFALLLPWAEDYFNAQAEAHWHDYYLVRKEQVNMHGKDVPPARTNIREVSR